ncbi:hypothetical protein [Nocardioides sp. AE5]|uniref:hypothetical protein n=1 Tax=Nocardioides sp. AE5 TaxID=2962573 RepID=UPI002880D828|nr:hypothetical protein [Nocardioides sp. AE5]MDT0201718.1 hypothetical protein [Nocardioides sp. AE5]
MPDNLRTGVSRADRYEPALNPAYAQLAEHYGTAVIPARVTRPRDKPVVKGRLRFVANQIAARLRNRRFVGLVEWNEAIFDEVDQINARGFQKREDSREVVFERTGNRCWSRCRQPSATSSPISSRCRLAARKTAS